MGIIGSIVFIGGGIFIYKFFHLFSPRLHYPIHFFGRVLPPKPVGGDLLHDVVEIQEIQKDIISAINTNTTNIYHIVGIFLIALGIFLGILLLRLSFLSNDNE